VDNVPGDGDRSFVDKSWAVCALVFATGITTTLEANDSAAKAPALEFESPPPFLQRPYLFQSLLDGAKTAGLEERTVADDAEFLTGDDSTTPHDIL
jgi:hypothetical protein